LTALGAGGELQPGIERLIDTFEGHVKQQTATAVLANRQAVPV
jgi:hypothetical protein